MLGLTGRLVIRRLATIARSNWFFSPIVLVSGKQLPNEELRRQLNFIRLASALFVFFFYSTLFAQGISDQYNLLIPGDFLSKFENLFKRHYPKVKFTNLGINGVSFEFQTTDFVYPVPKEIGKHENPIQKGQMPGGILGKVSCHRGEYYGQTIILQIPGKMKFPSKRIQKKDFSIMLAAPYSKKRGAHLWVRISYPKETKIEFWRELWRIMEEFTLDQE